MKTIDINHFFGGVQALKSVNVECKEGEITGLIGPNGSGKTTLVNVLTKVLSPSSGEVYGGEFFTRTFQDAKLWSNLTVLETFLLAEAKESWLASLIHFSSRSEIESAQKIATRVGLTEKLHERVRDLSYGQRKLVEIGRALASADSKVMYFDEPFAGLSDVSTSLVKKLIIEEKLSGKTVLIIEHDMNIIRAICDKVFVLDAGEVIAEGTPEECLGNERVRSAYLGV